MLPVWGVIDMFTWTSSEKIPNISRATHHVTVIPTTVISQQYVISNTARFTYNVSLRNKILINNLIGYNSSNFAIKGVEGFLPVIITTAKNCQTLHKSEVFCFGIFLINVNKSFAKEILNGKLHFCTVKFSGKWYWVDYV